MINLLPSQYKEELLTEETKKLILILGSLIFLFLLSLILILFSIKIYLASQLESQKIFLDLAKKERESTEAEELENKIESFNQKLSRLDNFYEKQIRPTEILDTIFKKIPLGIYLTNISYSKDPSQIFLSGFSPSRETLFQFDKNLKEEFGEKNVKFPEKNWIQPTNIDFTGVRISFGQ